ncbi:hypothetical protein [Arthrobacter sp. C152]
MTGLARALAPLLRAAWLLAATLALTAGILGMHVLTAGHASHASVSNATHGAGHTAVAHSAGAGHAGHAAPAADAPEPAAATCGDTCPGVHESGAPCVPTAPGNPVTLYPPEAGPAALPAPPVAGTRTPVHGYRPPSPTPCELSISRT